MWGSGVGGSGAAWGLGVGAQGWGSGAAWGLGFFSRPIGDPSSGVIPGSPGAEVYLAQVPPGV